MEMTKEQLFALALHIEKPWYVESIQLNAESKRIDIEINFYRGSEFYYESLDEGIQGHYKAYDTERKEWRHLNFFEYECYIKACVPRVKIGNGKGPRIIRVHWEGSKNGFTMLFEAMLLVLCREMAVHTVCRMTNVSDKKMWGLLDLYVGGSRSERNDEHVQRIGIDETKNKRGHQYVTLFVDMDKKQTLYVTEGKSSETVSAFKEDLVEHNGKPEQIKQFSCDMSKAFIKGMKQEFSGAEIVFDRFHIMQILNRAVDEVRRTECQHESILKKSKYLFLKNRENLTKRQARQLDMIEMSQTKLKTVKAFHMREHFQDIYQSLSQSEFEAKLKSWCSWVMHSRLDRMKEVVKIIRAHWYGIVNWKKHQISNGLLEGLNSIIQADRAKARGYRRTKNFITIIYLMTGKLCFNNLNPHYLPT